MPSDERESTTKQKVPFPVTTEGGRLNSTRSPSSTGPSESKSARKGNELWLFQVSVVSFQPQPGW